MCGYIFLVVLIHSAVKYGDVKAKEILAIIGICIGIIVIYGTFLWIRVRVLYCADQEEPMQFDNDISRRILMFIDEHVPHYYGEEALEDESYLTYGSVVSGVADTYNYDKNHVAYCLKVLIEGGIVSVCETPNYSHNGNIIFAKISGLSFQGHEYLANILDEGIWDNIKKKVTSTVGAASLAVMSMMSQEAAKDFFGIPRQ